MNPIDSAQRRSSIGSSSSGRPVRNGRLDHLREKNMKIIDHINTLSASVRDRRSTPSPVSSSHRSFASSPTSTASSLRHSTSTETERGESSPLLSSLLNSSSGRRSSFDASSSSNDSPSASFSHQSTFSRESSLSPSHPNPHMTPFPSGAPRRTPPGSSPLTRIQSLTSTRIRAASSLTHIKNAEGGFARSASMSGIRASPVRASRWTAERARERNEEGLKDQAGEVGTIGAGRTKGRLSLNVRGESPTNNQASITRSHTLSDFNSPPAPLFHSSRLDNHQTFPESYLGSRDTEPASSSTRASATARANNRLSLHEPLTRSTSRRLTPAQKEPAESSVTSRTRELLSRIEAENQESERRRQELVEAQAMKRAESSMSRASSANPGLSTPVQPRTGSIRAHPHTTGAVRTSTSMALFPSTEVESPQTQLRSHRSVINLPSSSVSRRSESPSPSSSLSIRARVRSNELARAPLIPPPDRRAATSLDFPSSPSSTPAPDHIRNLVDALAHLETTYSAYDYVRSIPSTVDAARTVVQSTQGLHQVIHRASQAHRRLLVCADLQAAEELRDEVALVGAYWKDVRRMNDELVRALTGLIILLPRGARELINVPPPDDGLAQRYPQGSLPRRRLSSIPSARSARSVHPTLPSPSSSRSNHPRQSSEPPIDHRPEPSSPTTTISTRRSAFFPSSASAATTALTAVQALHQIGLAPNPKPDEDRHGHGHRPAYGEPLPEDESRSGGSRFRRLSFFGGSVKS